MRSIPKVSIIMPVYNGGPYFELALQSALSQTYPNLEIVVVNDGSSDAGETERTARRYENRINYIVQENKGVAGALNTGVENMSGDIFTWLSHDDIYEPEKTAVQVDYYQRFGRRDAILFSDWRFINSKGDVTQDVAYDHDSLVKAPMLAMLIPCINGCTIFVPRHILQEMGPFEEKYRYTQDYHLWNKILRKYDFFHIPKKLIKYRIHPAQDSNKPAAVTEGDELWIKIIGDRSELEHVQMFGSSKRFYERMGNYFKPSPYQKASEYALNLSRICVDDSLVSVIIPLDRDAYKTLRTLRSVLAQTHRKLEVLLVETSVGTGDQLGAVWDERVRLLPADLAIGDALNRGLWAASGSYISIAGPGSQFLPNKVECQLRAMQDNGNLVSEAAYLITDQEGNLPIAEGGTENTGPASGKEGESLQTTERIMIHRSLVSEGFRFPSNDAMKRGEHALAHLSGRHLIFRIDEVLSINQQGPCGLS